MARKVTQGEWGRIIANAWLDPAFAQKLSTDPAAAVKDFLGLDAKSDLQVFEVPPKPADLTHAQLQDVKAGKAPGHMVAPYGC
jgi:hypothetical protein